jgi:hypothetical protein
MKKTFHKEIEDETAKLESYRQLKPPPTETPTAPARPSGSRPPQNLPSPSGGPRKTASVQAIGGRPPAPPPPPTLGKAPSSANIATKPVRKGKGEGDDLAWDDDELETQIYDDAPGGDAEQAKRRANTPPRPNHAVAAAAVEAPPPAAPPAPPMPGPDLSSLVSTGKGWVQPGSNPGLGSDLGRLPPVPPGASANGTPPHLAAGRVGSPFVDAGPPAGPFADDPSLLPASAAAVPALGSLGSLGSLGPPRETSVSARLVSAQEPNLFDPMASFGSGVMARRESSKKGLLFVAIGGGIAVVIAIVLVVTLTGDSTKRGKDVAPAVAPDKPDPAVAKVGDQNTGFDLYVTPSGVSQWKLDGELRTDRLPSRIRGIAPGVHEVAIEAPAGFMSHAEKVTVELGKPGKVEINLDALDITGEFESTPPGATVSLIVDNKRQILGPSPAKVKLDPHQTYQVLFEKPGYVSLNKPVTFTGATAEKVVVNLEKAGPVAVDDTPAPVAPTGPVVTPGVAKPPVVDNTPKPPKPPVDNPRPHVDTTPKPPVDKPPVDKPPVDRPPAPPATGNGTLALGSKPPCDIFVDGAATGQHTPARLPLAAGKHKITLVNGEFNIRETFTVDIKPDQVDRELKDYSDRLPH